MRFRSDSDTEVLLKGWAAWGEGLLDRLAGMFAFCLVEHASGRCVLARDRLGKKPLYLQELRDGGLRIASSLPALVAGGGVDTRVDPVALHHYLSFHSIVPAPRTILRGVRKLPPATVLVVEPDGSRRERRYWDPPFERDPARADWSAEDWEGAIMDALRVAVRRRMVSDVPVGILLSGGLDSSLIVALLAEQGQHGPGDVLRRLRGGRRPRGRRVRVLRPRGRRVRHRPPPDPRRAGAAAAGAAAGDRAR